MALTLLLPPKLERPPLPSLGVPDDRDKDEDFGGSWIRPLPLPPPLPLLLLLLSPPPVLFCDGAAERPCEGVGEAEGQGEGVQVRSGHRKGAGTVNTAVET